LAPRQTTLRIDSIWERAVQNILTVVYSHAARPIQGYLPSQAEAILFADEGEMIACLALDMVRGEAWNRWWWKLILRGLPSPTLDSLKMLLCRNALYLPAALHYLVAWEQAIGVINTLSPEQALTVLSAMSTKHEIIDLVTYLLQPKKSLGHDVQAFSTLPPDAHKPEEGTSQSGDPFFPQQPDTPSIPKMPWEKWLPSTFALKSLGKERECLLGVGLSLYHEPAQARTHIFLQALHNWWIDQERRVVELDPDLDTDTQIRSVEASKTDLALDDPIRVSVTKSGSSSEIDIPYPVDEFSQEVGSIPATEVLNSKNNAEPGETESLTASGNREQVGDKNQQTANNGQRTLLPSSGQATDNGPFYQAQDKRQITDPSTKLSAGNGQQATDNGQLLREGVDTQLSGILYLINLMRRLDLPACFEKEWGLASQVGAWGVLEVLGRGLLGQGYEHLAEDPIWKALAELDGREPGKLPEEAFRGSPDFHLPIIWINSDNIDLAKLSPKLPGQPPVDNLTNSLLKRLNPYLLRWLSLVLPYIRFYLQRALNPKGTEELDLAKTLLLHRGRLYVTSTHVDLVMRLDDISLPVRLAGLDCNPGWMADFGRVVQFYFK
jgi:hypothetical protein